MNMQRIWNMLIGLSGLIAVGMGAAAAHAISEPHAAAMVEKAALYQLIHAVALLYMLEKTGRVAQISRWCWFVGAVLFSGSIYLKGFGLAASAPTAPLGGTLLMVGWALAAVHYTGRKVS